MWLQWFDTLISEPHTVNPSWLPERLEYAFSVSARLGDGEHPLTAQEYAEGHLDWYAFDANTEIALGAATDGAAKEVVGTAIPAPASFRGMPAARFWEFEDAQVDFGAVDAGPTDLARMLLVNFRWRTAMTGLSFPSSWKWDRSSGLARSSSQTRSACAR